MNRQDKWLLSLTSFLAFIVTTLFCLSLVRAQQYPLIQDITAGSSAGTQAPSGCERDISSSSAALGATSPTATTIETYRGLAFDADGELAFLNLEVPDSWDGASDMTLEVDWFAESGDVLADGETVVFDITFRSLMVGEAFDNGTVATSTGTYTQSGAGTDKEHITTSVTIDYDNANQPLMTGDMLGVKFNRDVTADNYSGDAIVVDWHLEWTPTAGATCGGG